MLTQVISGAQIGADIAALRAAKACGFDTGGFVPKGGRTKMGPLSQEAMNGFCLTETESSGYPERTEKNVRAADGTLLLAYNWLSPGEKLTKRLIHKHGKPSFGIDLEKIGGQWRVMPYGSTTREGIYKVATQMYARHVAGWIRKNKVSILNVAGNGNQEIEACVEWFLTQVFVSYKQMYVKDFNAEVEDAVQRP